MMRVGSPVVCMSMHFSTWGVVEREAAMSMMVC